MKTRYFTKEQRLKIYQWLDDHRDDPCAVMLDVLATTGCRVDELMRIQFVDINRHDLTVTIQHGSKGSESRTRRLGESLINAIYDLKSKRQLSDHDFISDLIVAKSTVLETKKRLLARYFAILKYHLFKNDKLPSLHGFRHSKAMIVYEETNNPYAVKLALGHTSMGSTEHYLTFVDEAKYRDVFAKRG